MKFKQWMAITVGALLMGNAVMAQGNYDFTFSSGLNNNGVVPDGDLSGLAITTNLTGLDGSIGSLTLNLNISGGYNGDLYAYLAGPNGGFAVLLNRSGVSNNASLFGYSDAGFNVTFDDTAANSIQYYQSFSPGYSGGQLTGTWQPAGLDIDPQSSPSAFWTAYTGGGTALLNSFDGTDPNGTWTLFLADLSGGGQSTLSSWGLSITTVPEPATWAMAGLALGAGWVLMRRK